MHTTRSSLVLFVAIALACSAGGESPKKSGDGGTGGTANGGTGGIGIGGSGGTINPNPPCEVCEDFPVDPILDESGGALPPNVKDLFGPPENNSGSGGPCLFEPAIGALFPKNWWRPRFRYTAPGQDLFEIRVHAEREKNDLVVYTKSLSWMMPAEMWVNLAAHVQEEPITVTVRSLNSASPGVPMLGSSGDFHIAPVEAAGKMVYWAAIGEAPGEAWLKGFGVGEEGVLTALQVPQVQQAGRKDQGGNPKGNGSVTCIGCHTSTPDGEAVAFTDHWPWGNAMASVVEETVGNVPPYLTPGAQEALNQPWLGVQTFSKAHWSAGDRVVITSYGRNSGQIWDGQTVSEQPNARLAWFNLETPVPAGPVTGTELAATEGTSYGFIARNGDTRGAMTPSWSHDGNTIAYVSTNAGKDGRLAMGEADLWTVPYNDKAGGNATPIAGASDPAFGEYYPAYSPDDALIAFNRAPGGQDMYYNPNAEVYVVPSSGGTATRLAANDPPQCSGLASPGITNSWPKWSPEAQNGLNGRKYYWLIFSSSRDGYTIQKLPAKKASQLYMAAVVEEGGTLKTYSGVYLWNQPIEESNHTPAWDVFKIPTVPIK
jgi:hypothetical protein